MEAIHGLQSGFDKYLRVRYNTVTAGEQQETEDNNERLYETLYNASF